MAGLVPAIHVFDAARKKKDVDARDKRGHDEKRKSPARWGNYRTGPSRPAIWAGGGRRPNDRLAFLWSTSSALSVTRSGKPNCRR